MNLLLLLVLILLFLTGHIGALALGLLLVLLGQIGLIEFLILVIVFSIISSTGAIQGFTGSNSAINQFNLLQSKYKSKNE